MEKTLFEFPIKNKTSSCDAQVEFTTGKQQQQTQQMKSARQRKQLTHKVGCEEPSCKHVYIARGEREAV